MATVESNMKNFLVIMVISFIWSSNYVLCLFEDKENISLENNSVPDTRKVREDPCSRKRCPTGRECHTVNNQAVCGCIK
jgi:hypothetical protein